MRAPGGTRSSVVSGTGETLALASGDRQAANPEPLDAPRIGVEHLEFEAAGMRDHLAAPWHPPGEGKDEATQRVHLVAVAVMAQPRAVLLIECLDRQARVGDDATIGARDQGGRLINIVLVLDLADFFIDKILDHD